MWPGRTSGFRTTSAGRGTNLLASSGRRVRRWDDRRRPSGGPLSYKLRFPPFGGFLYDNLLSFVFILLVLRPRGFVGGAGGAGDGAGGEILRPSEREQPLRSLRAGHVEPLRRFPPQRGRGWWRWRNGVLRRRRPRREGDRLSGGKYRGCPAELRRPERSSGQSLLRR